MKAKKYHIIVLLFLVPLLLGMGIDLYVPSLPQITKYYQVNKGLVQLTISLYMFGYAVGQLFFGIVSDIYGRRNIMLISCLLFVLMSFLAIFSPNIYFLNVCRFLQGIAIAGLSVTIRSVVVDCFNGLALSRAMTYISTSWALGPIIGPAIGGYLQHYFNWQADFYFFALYGLLILLYIFFTLPETNKNRLSLQINNIFKTFKHAVTHRVFLLGNIICALLYSSLVIFNLIGPFLVQVTLKYSVVNYGHIALLLGLGYFIGNFLNQFLLSHFKSITIIWFGIIMAIFFSIIMLLLAIFMPLNLYNLIIPSWLIFFAAGLVFPNVAANVVSIFPNNAGIATALSGTFITGGVFVITILVANLHTCSALPIASIYVGIFSVISIARLLIIDYK